MDEGPLYTLRDDAGLEKFRERAYNWGYRKAAEVGSPISEDDVLDYMDEFVESDEVDDWDRARSEFQESFYMGWDTYYQQNIT